MGRSRRYRPSGLRHIKPDHTDQPRSVNAALRTQRRRIPRALWHCAGASAAGADLKARVTADVTAPGPFLWQCRPPLRDVSGLASTPRKLHTVVEVVR
jgi:hypothetical protein